MGSRSDARHCTPGNVHFQSELLSRKVNGQVREILTAFPNDETMLAHANNSMTCYACHSSMDAHVFRRHLQMTAM